MKRSSQVLDLIAGGLLFLVCLPLITAFFKPGYFTTHDSDYHLVRLAHFAREVENGHFPVRIVPQLAEGYGYATFNYFYPLPYLLALIPHYLGASLGESLKLIMVLSTVLFGAGMYVWLRDELSIKASWLGTFISLWVPYRLVTQYVTGQLGGAVALAFVPWLIWVVGRWFKQPNAWHLPLISLLVGGLITAHLLTLFAFVPLFVCLGLGWWWQYRPSRQNWFYLALAGLGGVGLASFYLLPAFLERSYVKMGQEVLVKFEDHWPTLKQLIYSPWGYGYSMTGAGDGMSFQLGLAQLWIGVAVLAWLVIGAGLKSKDAAILFVKSHSVAVAVGVGTLISILLMLPAAEPLWRVLFFLPYLQYPWRLLAVPMVGVGFLAAWLAQRSKLGLAAVVLAIILAVFGNRNYLRTWELTRYPDEHYLSNSTVFNGSTDISWEALPIQTTTHPVGPATSLVVSPLATVSAKPAHHHSFTLELDKEQPVVLALLYYPQWHVTLNGQKRETSAGPNGLLSFIGPAGKHQVDVRLVSTPIEQVANWTTVVSLAILAIAVLFFILKPSRDKMSSARYHGKESAS